jgi:hypothetical protein
MASHIPAMRKPSRAQHRPQGAGHVPDFKRHRRKCIICHHPQREAIEELFVEWHSPRTISDLFDIDDWFTIYRHAHATGLFLRRRRNLRSALERVIEYAGHSSTTINGIGIVRAVRAYACLTDTGEWIEPATRVIVSRAEPITEPAARVAPARRQIEAAVISHEETLPALPPASQPAPVTKPSCPQPVPASEPVPTSGGLGHVPLISLARVRSGWRPNGRASNRKPPGLETGATHSEQRSATDANRKK